jgi:hypothetical protein
MGFLATDALGDIAQKWRAILQQRRIEGNPFDPFLCFSEGYQRANSESYKTFRCDRLT